MKFAPRKVYIKENGGYTELSYEDFCRRRETDGAYKDKLFIPVQGCLIETEQTHYIEFYRDKEAPPVGGRTPQRQLADYERKPCAD